jgi:membrane protease YdiL (CAAX protease family)
MAALDGFRAVFGSRADPRASTSLLAVLTVFWGVVMLQFGEREIYAIVGTYALFVSAVVLVLYRREAGRWFRARARDLAIGLLVGALMTALTYPIYHLAVSWLPALAPLVAGLYRTSHEGHVAAALLWVLVIIAAEELLFRGAWLAVLERQLGRHAAFGLSVALYAGAQAFSGSWIVGFLALCCGALWTLERMLTGSLVAPLVSHMIWTPTVILLHPVIH